MKKHTQNKSSLIDLFPKHLFWDIDYSKLSIKANKEIIIPRALFSTNINSFDNDITKLETL